jgi:hypothetical protein
MRLIAAMCAAAVVGPTLLAGQTPAAHWPIAPDSRVRIVSPVLGERFVTGSLVSATPDTLVFRADTESTSTAIPTPTIVRLDVGFGKHTNKARGGVAGFIFGALAGAAIGFGVTPAPCTNCLDFSQGYAAVGGGVAGGVIGALVGVAIGKRPSDNWVPVALPSPAPEP